MTLNENQITSLPFYTDTKYQDRNKWWVDNVYRLISPNNKYLPFQIIKNITDIGGATCPVPASIDYTADFSTTIDSWFSEIVLGDISLNITHDTNRIKIDVTNNSPGTPYVFNMKRTITATRYKFNAGDIVATVRGSTADCEITAFGVPGYEDVLPSGTTIENGYTIDEGGTGDDSRNYVVLSFYNAVGTDRSFYIESFVSSSTPYFLLNPDTVYQSNFTSSVDGWTIFGSGTASLSYAANELVLTYNSESQVSIRRALSYTNEYIENIAIEVKANQGVLYQYILIGKNGSGGSLYRSVVVNHDFDTDGNFDVEIENTDNWAEFTDILLVMRANGETTTEFSDITLDILEQCVPASPNVWSTAELIDVKTGVATDIATYMNANTEVLTYSEYQVAIYDASVNLASNLDSGFYYIHLYDGDTHYYSEVFLACGELSEYIKIEWWSDNDIIFEDGRIAYSSGFINTMYVEGDIGKPQYLYEIEEEERNGYKFVEKVVSFKRFNFDILIPEAIADVLSRLPNHEYVTIVSESITYRATKVEILEPEWEGKGDLTIFRIEFETYTVMSTGARVAGTINELLANETEAINIRGNNKRIYQLSDTTDFDDLYLVADKSTLTEAVRIPFNNLNVELRSKKATLSAGNNQTILFDSSFSDEEYDYIIQAISSSGSPTGFEYVSHDAYGITINLYEPATVTVIANKTL